MTQTLMVRRLGTKDYFPIWQQMQQFTDARTSTTPDEIWLLQHPAVFTQGLAGKPEHLLNPGTIPVVQTDRGGQVTYHGPGQLVAYTLLDLNRLNLGTRQLVTHLENAIIGLLAEYDLQAAARRDAPGVYIDAAKIASIGLRIRKGFSYHGIAINIDMDLAPFSRINPCGYSNMPIQQLSHWVNPIDWVAIEAKIIHYLAASFNYQTIEWVEPK